jgi:hypothetical protein
MQTQLTAKDQVQVVLAKRILQRLDDVEVSEEDQLIEAVRTVHQSVTSADHGWERHTKTSFIPRCVIVSALRSLYTDRFIRRIRFDGRNYIALASLERDELISALEERHDIADLSWWRTDARIRRDDYSDGITTLERAHTMPLSDPDEEHASQSEHFGLSWEAAAAASPLDAEIPPNHSREIRDYQVKNPGIDQFTRALVDHQLETNQAQRNAERAHRKEVRAWLATDEGIRWSANQHAEREYTREEDVLSAI